MRNTRKLPVISDGKSMGEHDVEYGRKIEDPEDLSAEKRNWYVRNTRYPKNISSEKRVWNVRNTRNEDKASSEFMPQYNWNNKNFQDSQQGIC